MILLSKGKHKCVISSIDTDDPGAPVTILLDYTQFPETALLNYKKVFDEKTIVTLDMDNPDPETMRYFTGWKIFFALDYSSKAGVDTVYDFAQIEDRLNTNTKKMMFQFRDDDNTFDIEVISVTDDVNLKLRYGDDAYEGLKIYLMSKKTHKLLNFQKPVIINPPTEGGGTINLPFEG